MRRLSLAAFALLTAVPLARGQSVAALTTLHSFTGIDGGSPGAGLLLGSDGNLYGTTAGVKADNAGTVFKITPAGALTILHTFVGGVDGSTPEDSLIQGGGGNLYGTTSGTAASTGGTIFTITTTGTITTLYDFLGSTDGSNPVSSLVQGTDKNLYGTTSGGTTGYGSVFEITTTGALTVLYDFTDGNDGSNPAAGLIEGGDGSFYGTTAGGGAYGDGTVFKVTTAGVLTTLHSFTGGADGSNPVAGLIRPGDGYFYGTTSGGGADDYGTVFKITTTGTLTTLYSFAGGTDGGEPAAALLAGSDGSLYGTTVAGGSDNDGVVFRMTTAGALTTLYSFTGGTDGSAPDSSLIEDGSGNFYGTTSTGGARTYGTVFKLSVHPAFFDGEAALADNAYYLAFSSGTPFGYYSFLTDPNYLYHFDLGYEYVFAANDGSAGVYLYDFASNDFFYTSPTFPFPYLYDFNLNAVLYYFPDASNAGHYTTNPRYFYNFGTTQVITK